MSDEVRQSAEFSRRAIFARIRYDRPSRKAGRMISRGAIASTAASWIGTPFVHQASLKGVGCDCVGLVAGVANDLGMPEAKAWSHDVRYLGYGRLPLPDK